MLIEIYGKAYSIDEIGCREVGKKHKYMDNQICKLINLRALYLHCNKIEVICKEIENLTNLKKLYLSYNLIEVICKEIGKLVKLRTIYLNHNKIKVICKEISKLKRLLSLWFHENNIKGTGSAIKRLISLIDINPPNNHHCHYNHKRINKRWNINIRCLFLFN